MSLQQDISQRELYIYAVIWITSVLYSIFCFAKSSGNRFQYYDDFYSDFKPGWYFLSRKKDSGDSEWQLINYLLKKFFWWVAFSVLVSEILRQLKLTRILQYWQIVIAFIFIFLELGYIALGLILCQPFIFAIVLKIKPNKFIIWIVDIIILMLLLMLKMFVFTEEFITYFHLTDSKTYMIHITMYWTNLRCLSYSIDFADRKENQLNLKFLSYCLYMPHLVYGPFIPYEDFRRCYPTTEDLWNRVFKLILNVFRFLFWFFFTEFCLHFIYINAINFHPEWIRSFNSWSLYGYGYTMGQFFHIKYVIMYGLCTTFSKFENVKVPSVPVCIGRIHLYSDMWKYFDAGLYNFLLRYIYIPLMKNYNINRLFSSLMSFVFVYVWHGTDYFIFVWSTLNYLGIVIEQFSLWIHIRYLQNSKLVNTIGCKWYRRLTCMISSPLLVMSAISNFYFFTGAKIGYIFIHRFFNDKIWSTAILMAIIYTLCQVSTEIRSKKASRKEKTKYLNVANEE